MNIGILDDYQGVSQALADWSTVASKCSIEIFREPIGSSDLQDQLARFEIISAMRERTQFPRELLEKLENLRLLVTTGMRNSAIDLEAATDLGILVCGTRSVAHSTVELTWALILSLLRSIPLENSEIRRGIWQTTVGQTLKGKTLGVLGLGRLGTEVARIGQAFGMSVISWSQNLNAKHAQNLGVKAVSRGTLFRQSDVLTIHLVLSERTLGLVDMNDLVQMKPSAFLVNTSRGPIVEKDALAKALRENMIRGAGLDVFDEEPVSMSEPLLNLSNTILTPHLGYVSEDGYRVFFGDTVENILAYLDSDPIRILNESVLGKMKPKR